MSVNINFIGNSWNSVTNLSVTRHGDTRVSCYGNKLIKLDHEFHHSIINNTSVVINSLNDQGKYLCLNKNNIPINIDYVHIAGMRGH